MRISGGSARGRTWQIPKGMTFRPTEERVRQALFNILGPSTLEGTRFLDLFCGSGAVGLEAISRGAASSTFVDSEPRCLELVTKTAQRFGFLESSIQIQRSEVARALPSLALRGGYHVIFMDPPYDLGLGEDALRQIAMLDTLRIDGVFPKVVLEHSSRERLPQPGGNLVLLRNYGYGNAQLSLYGENHAD